MTELIKTNEYSGSIRRLSEERLREYVDTPDNYHDDAVLAALWELERRRPLSTDEQRLETDINERIEKSKIDTVRVKESIRSDFKTDEIALPSLYSIRAIQVFSVFFSVLAGGILMAINFNRTTQKIEAVKVIGFSIAYTIVSVLLFALIGSQSPFISIILNLLGAYLIYELFWKRVLGSEFRFKKQNIWSALIIAMLLISPLVWYVIKSGALQTF